MILLFKRRGGGGEVGLPDPCSCIKHPTTVFLTPEHDRPNIYRRYYVVKCVVAGKGKGITKRFKRSLRLTTLISRSPLEMYVFHPSREIPSIAIKMSFDAHSP